ncbi:MAG: zinc ribbon domain-containing protein [Elusimicrobiales bacterium]|nr:zinc ribbon domain-containing protein [Elusimicrobiales bacterium]
MKEKFCQSCGMPLAEGLFGTEKDGSESNLYCKYCFKEGKFTQDVTLDEMADICAVHLVQAHPEFSLAQAKAKAHMLSVLPRLSRWKK